VRVTGTAQWEAWLARTSPPVEQVRPDLWSVPVPIPGMRRAALAEAAAHLHHLADAGRITQIAEEPGLYSLPDQP